MSQQVGTAGTCALGVNGAVSWRGRGDSVGVILKMALPA